MIKYYGLSLLCIVFSQLDIWFSFFSYHFYYLSYCLAYILHSVANKLHYYYYDKGIFITSVRLKDFVFRRNVIIATTNDKL